MSTSTRSARTPQEIYAHHKQALAHADLEAVVADYDDRSVIITSAGVLRGQDAARAFFAEVFAAVPQAEWRDTLIFEGDVLFCEWTVDSFKNSVSDGVDTFVFRDGMILVQTVRCTIVPKA